VFGTREFAFLLGERNSSLSVVDVVDPGAPRLLQMLPAPFRPEGAVTIPQRNLVVVSGEGPNGGALNDEFLGGGVWIYQGVALASEVQSYPQNVLQAYSDSVPFGGISGGTWNGVEDQLIATTDAIFARQRIWTFQLEQAGQRMKLASELLLSDASGAPLTGYDPEGIAVNPEGGYVLATEGTVGNGGSPAGTCTGGNEKLRNRLLFVQPDGRLDPAYGGGDGIVDLPCVAAGEANGIDWSALTGNGFEGVAVIDGNPAAAGGLKVYAVVQRPLSAGDPAGLCRIGEYDVDSASWSFYFYPLVPDLTGARNAIVLSELTHLGGDQLAVLERDQRRTGSSSVKRIYRVRLSSGGANDSSDPLDKELAVDLLDTPFRFDFEKVETIALTPHGTYVANDNDGGEEAAFFYRIGLVATEGPGGGEAGSGEAGNGGAGSGEAGGGGTGGGGAGSGGTGGAGGTGGSGGTAGTSGGAARVVINEVLSTGSPDFIELYNAGDATADLTGWTLTDNDPTHIFAIPAGTTLAPGAYLGFGDVLGFGLGSADSAILFDPALTAVDRYDWTAHVSSHGRCPNGSGGFQLTAVPSSGAANACP
jgi:hypothetical protein